MRKQILLSAPDVTGLEEQYVVDAMRSGWIAPLGPDVEAFENEMCDEVGVSHAVALSSGTAALHLALLCKGVGPGDVVPTSSMTFAATANAIVYTGAEPYFIDCDPETGNMDPLLLEKALTELATQGERVGAVVPVDLFGKAAEYGTISRLTNQFDVPLIADCAESLGATHGGEPAASWGAAAALSFNGNKIMTTSGGGMLVTDDPALADRARYLATQARQPVAHYEHTEIGYNYRLSNLLAALGRAQLVRLDEMVEKRRRIRARYRSLFHEVDGVSILGGRDVEDNCWLTSICVEPSEAGWEPSALMYALASKGIECRRLWKPMHLQPVFSDSRSAINGSADHLFTSGITLPSGSALTTLELDYISDAINDFLDSRK
ncbi:DegT/DnrJ/EryC1/StrS family aminotransferase [Arthrobacter pigmenti]